MLTLLSFVVVLGILIFVHELGHFAVAKALGIGVETFSFGFGPKLFGFRIGETDYRISAFPLGGYVKMTGENPGEEARSARDPRSFSTRPVWQRGAVVLAGPVMNLALAFIILPTVFLLGIRVPAYLEQPVVVGWIAPGSPSELAGIGRGDRVISADGRAVDDWERLYNILSESPAGEVPLTVVRAGQEARLTLPWKGKDAGEELGISPPAEPVIGALTPGYPAVKAGLMKGDLVLSVGGVTVSDFAEMAQIIRTSGGKPLNLKVRRPGKVDGEILKIEVTPKLDEKSGRGLLGVVNETPYTTRKYPLVSAVSEGTKLNVERIGLTFRTLGDLLTLRGSIKEVGGPIMIFQVTGSVAKSGLIELIGFIAFLSLQLAIFNLLPVPILDGGHVLFLGVEAVIRRPVHVKHREIAQQVGLALLLLLILVVSYNDIVRLVTTR